MFGMYGQMEEEDDSLNDDNRTFQGEAKWPHKEGHLHIKNATQTGITENKTN